MVMERRGRDRLYIMAQVLDTAKEDVLKTQIMYRANLSFAQLNDYLSLLVDLKFLDMTTNDRKTTYKTTKKGSRFLDVYKELVQILREEIPLESQKQTVVYPTTGDK